MFTKENIITKVVESGGRLSVRSALNPILWLCAIITIPSLIALPFFNKTPFWLILLIISPVGAAIIGFFFLLLFDRDKLQSEEYQLKKRSMELVQEKGQPKPQVVDPNKIKAIEDPSKPKSK